MNRISERKMGKRNACAPNAFYPSISFNSHLCRRCQLSLCWHTKQWIKHAKCRVWNSVYSICIAIGNNRCRHCHHCHMVWVLSMMYTLNENIKTDSQMDILRNIDIYRLIHTRALSMTLIQMMTNGSVVLLFIARSWLKTVKLDLCELSMEHNV